MRLRGLWLSLILFSQSLFAHVIWLEKLNNVQWGLLFGHQQTESYPEKKVQQIQLVFADGQKQPANWTHSNGQAQFDVGSAELVLAAFDNGIWSKLPNGRYVEKSRAEEPSAELSMQALKLTKHILLWQTQATLAQQQPYELVPQGLPQVGKPLTLQVLVAGKPQAGVKVGRGEEFPFELSDKQGLVTFTPTLGQNKIWAEFDEPLHGQNGLDQRSVEYILSFELKQ